MQVPTSFIKSTGPIVFFGTGGFNDQNSSLSFPNELFGSFDQPAPDSISLHCRVNNDPIKVMDPIGKRSRAYTNKTKHAINVFIDEKIITTCIHTQLDRKST